MTMLPALIPSLAIILCSIDSSLQSGYSPDDEPLPDIPGSRNSDPSVRYSSSSARSRSRSPPGSHHTASLPSSKPSSSSSVSARSLFPPTRLPSNNGHGYALKDLEFLRFTPRTNRQLILELRRYTFPSETRIRWRINHHELVPIPNEEQIVLSSSDGDALAIFETTNILAGMYVQFRTEQKRARINMESGMVTVMTPEERNQIPVGQSRLITRNFLIKRLSRDYPKHLPTALKHESV